MPCLHNDDLIDDLVWSAISGSASFRDFLTYLQHFSIEPRHRAEAIDRAVALHTFGEVPEGEYAKVLPLLQELVTPSTDDAVRAKAYFNIGKLFHLGYGVTQNRDSCISAYEQAIALGEVRALINLGAFHEDYLGSEPEVSQVLFDQALALGEPVGLIRMADRIANEADPRRYELCAQAAEMGAPLGAYRLGVFHMLGTAGCQKDPEIAISWFTRAARAGHAYAHYHLGWHYESGTHIKRDLDTAMAWFQEGAKQGDASCMRALGHAYAVGEGFAEDAEESLRWYQRSAVLGDRTARRAYGMRLFWSKEESKERDGVEWMTLAACDGDYIAADQLEYAYRMGIGAEVNLNISATFCLMAAKGGITQAQGQMGLNYWFGRGVEENHAEAYAWFSTAALAGGGKELYLLARATKDGVGVTANDEEAFKLFSQAAEKGHDRAIYEVGECYFYGSGVTQNIAQAVVHYKKAAALGNTDAMTDLGLLLYEGEYVANNYEEAAGWFQKACDLDNARAMFFLGLLYEEGDGVAQDSEQARRLIGKSAALGNSRAKRWVEENLPDKPAWLTEMLAKPVGG